MASLDILCFSPFNLRNKIMKIKQKIFHGPSKILKNSWPLQSPSAPPPLPPSYILNVQSLRATGALSKGVIA